MSMDACVCELLFEIRGGLRTSLRPEPPDKRESNRWNSLPVVRGGSGWETGTKIPGDAGRKEIHFHLTTEACKQAERRGKI